MGSWLLGSLMGRGRAEKKATGYLRTFGKAGLFLALGFIAGCGGGGSSSNPGGVSVTITPTTASLALNAAQQFTATVTNDSTNRGVTWTLTQNGTACAPSCGFVFPTVTASGTPTTYTAPGVVPPFSSGVTLTATAVVNSNAKASAAIVIAGTIAVSVTPANPTIALGGTQIFTGNAANDTTSDGLTWGLTQNGSACSPGCGTITSGSKISCGTVTPPSGGFCTSNGGFVTYTAPTTAPSSNSVLLTATDIAAPGESGFAIIQLQSGITIAISPTFANVPINGTQKFTATVTNDSTNKGVTWALSQNGASCSASACGTLSATTSSSGTAITYTAPNAITTVTLTATSVANTSDSAFATIQIQPISVTVSPQNAILYSGGTAQFTATVDYDPAEKGVTWSLLINGAACQSSVCGTISPTSTAAGVQTTYTAPSSITSQTNVTVVATSVTDTTKSASATVSLYPPATVSVSPSAATIALGSRGNFTATVANDPTNAGVTWSLTQGGQSCSPACGTVSPTTTASGVATVYIAPSTMPSSPTVTLQATSNAELSQSNSATITLSSASVAKLSGNYAFLFNGYASGSTVVMAGSFSADGAGNVTGGVADVHSTSGVTTSLPLTGSYTVGPDNTGTLTWASPSQQIALGTFRFALNSSGDHARFIEIGRSGARGWGTLDKQRGAASAAALQGDYIFSATGADALGSRYVLAGRFHANGAGGISAGLLDSNDGGVLDTALPFAGSYSVSATGRGTLTAQTPNGTVHFAFYMIAPGDLVLISTDSNFSGPVIAGEAKAQTAGRLSAEFTAASLQGTSVISLAGTAGAAATKVAAGRVTFDGAGGLHYSIDQNDGGEIAALTGIGTYSVEPNGRVTLWLSSIVTPLISYLQAPNQGVVVGTGAGASAGSLDAQSPGIFSDASFSGGYVIGTSAAPSSAASLESGVLTSTGLGRMTGESDVAALDPLDLSAKNFQTNYSVAPSGRVAIANGASILYLISPFEGVVVDVRPGNSSGTISRIEK